MRASVNLRDGRVETKVDVVVGIETRIARLINDKPVEERSMVVGAAQ